MKHLLHFTTEDGTDLFIEVNETLVTESTRGTNPNDRGIVQNARETLDKALKPLKEVSNSIINCIKDITSTPSEVEVELGLKFTAKAGIIISSLDSETHFRIVFKWNNKKGAE